ncbi:MAG: GNAT family N-acetyltransferase, partial [Roseiflexaceae bacterium]
HYAIFHADEIVARGRSLRMPTGFSYVSMVYVAPSYRRQGYGRALMQAMLRDDCAARMHTSTLMASYDGAALYATLGYETVAQTHVFTL